MEPFCYLVSYFYTKHRTIAELIERYLDNDPDCLLFLDSGAFSALTRGAAIRLEDYATYLAANQQHCHLMANLDVIGHDADSAEATWSNFRTLREEWGLPVLPVMHVGEPLEMLDRYLDAGEQYIALGGLVQTPWKIAAPWTVAAFQRAQGHAVFHGFGVSGFNSQRFLPWYTVDHTSWQQGVVVMAVRLFDGTRPRMFNVRKASANNPGGPSTYTSEFNRLCRSYGVDPKRLRTLNGIEDVHLMLTLSARSVARQDAYMRRRHGLIHHPSGFAPPGLRTFLATASPRFLRTARDAQRSAP